jgi:3D (Asp-Asp-Asp) domain-containing protein
MRVLLAILFILISCGRNSSHKVTTTLPSQRETHQSPFIPAELDPSETVKIPDLLPTMYYIATEDQVPCKGKYGNANYNGTERSTIKTMEGDVIAEVCTRFAKTLAMEGSAVLKDRGHGTVSVNFSGIVNGEKRFHALERCIYGEGVDRDLCLLPYHTIAADNKAHPVGEIVFVPKAVGLKLPDGSLHEGYFIVRDTGGAFTGIGMQRVDLFTGLDPDFNNVFSRAGFNHHSPTPAFRIKGQSAEIIKDKLHQKFGDLY